MVSDQTSFVNNIGQTRYGAPKFERGKIDKGNKARQRKVWYVVQEEVKGVEDLVKNMCIA